MTFKNSIAKLISCLLCLTLLFTATVAFAEETTKTDKFAIFMNPTRNYLIVVNEDHPYEFGGEYDEALKADLVALPDVDGEPTYIERAAAFAFQSLQYDLMKKGITIGFYSGYRTSDDQQWVYDYYSNLEGWSETNKVLKPGYSEHHTGLMLNIMVLLPGDDGNPIWYTMTPERRKEFPEVEVLYSTLADYGFIERYPEGKEDITGIPAEPYEIRFVGSSAIAHSIMDGNYVLEELNLGD